MLLAGKIALALLFGGVAFGYFRAGAAFDWQYRWRTRREDARHFWAQIVFYSGLALIFAALAVWDAITSRP